MSENEYFDPRYVLQQKRKAMQTESRVDLNVVPEVEPETEDVGKAQEQAQDAPMRALPDIEIPEESDMTVSAEMTPAGTSMSMTEVGEAEQGPDFASLPKYKPKTQKTKPKVVPEKIYVNQKVTRPSVRMVYIRGVPQPLVSIIRGQPGLSEASNMTDAIVAYLAVELGDRANLTPEQLRLADSYSRQKKEDNPIEKLQDTIERMFKYVKRSEGLAKELEMGVNYLLLDRLGFRKDNPSRPGDVDLLEPGFEDLLKRLRTQTAQYDMREKRKNGTPIR